ncbi:Transcriptional regulator, LacI family [[Actinomadura] parvosata subsp. kistnae]|nr:Transcriptional regulator, LacI family [Actinomadura parvosata subsp. kistnae]
MERPTTAGRGRIGATCRAPPAGHGRRGQTRRRVAPDRLPGAQRPPQGQEGDARAGPARHHRPRLPPQPDRAGAGHPPLAPARGGQLRHHPVRPGQHRPRHRAGGQGGRLLRQHHEPAHHRPGRRQRGHRPPGRAGRGRRGRGRAAARRRPGAGRPAPGLPAVAVEGRHEGEVAVVSVDQREGARHATAHLLALGHDTVWHVSGPDDWLEAEGRQEGWRAALAAAGREIPEVLAGDWTPRSGYRAGRVLAARVAEVTAVFVANDQMALGLLRAFSEAGVRVPEQVSVVGFDDIPEAAYFTPALTTVRQDFGEVGRLSIGLLLKQIESSGTSGYDHLIVPPRFVIRDSTGRARSALPY